jgi:antirestriction protein ArdC
LQRTTTDEQANEVAAGKRFPLARFYVVFNRQQIDGLPAPKPVEPLPEKERHVRAEHFVRHTEADIQHGGGKAAYVPDLDRILLPLFESFRSAHEYYATALHELTHWTAAPDRLARQLGGRFGDEAYAAEELVAELGAAFLCATLGLDGRCQHPEYIANWLRVLKNDKRAIFTASSKAQAAAEFLTRLVAENRAATAA